jgi:hypothetical protein
MATQEKNGSSVMPAEISGVWVDLHPIPKGVAVDRCGARLLLERKLGIKPRQQRATVSSYSVEGWAYQGADGARFFGVSSLDNRMLEHVDRRVDSRIENGRKGGRPRRAPWDVTPSSAIKQRQVIETRVAAEQREPLP